MATVRPPALTFTTTDWAVARTVTVTGVDDDAVNLGPRTARVAHAFDGGGYDDGDGVTVPDVTVTVTDDDAGATVSESSLAVSELDDAATPGDERTATWTVALAARPAGPVTVTPESSDPLVATVRPAVLTFTPTDWAVARTVTVTGVDDHVVTLGPRTARVAHAFAGGGYDGVTAGEVEVTVANDGIAVALSRTAARVDEEAGTAAWTVALSARPLADVTVTVASLDPSAVRVRTSASPLRFTPASWNLPRTVIATGVPDDALGDRATAVVHTAAGPDSGFDGKTARVEVTVADADRAGVTVAVPGTPLAVAEGGAATWTVVLDAVPADRVTVHPLARGADGTGPTGAVTVHPAVLTFTPADWAVARTVTVTGTSDDVVGDRHATIVPVVQGRGSGYHDLAVPSIPVTVTDDDAGVTVAASPLVVTETGAGASAAYTVVLEAAPAGTVTVTPAARGADGTGRSGAVRVRPAALTFTPADWAAARTVTVAAVPDDLPGSRRATVAHTVAGRGSGYHGVPAAPVPVTVTDDDAVVTVTGSPLVVAESAGTATYEVVLEVRPTGPVTVTPSSRDPAVATASPAALTFTAADWDTARTVTVTGVPAGDTLRDRAVAVAHAVEGGGYGAVPVADVAVTVTNADAGALTLRYASFPGSLRLAEAGAATYTVALAREPVGAVTVTPLARRYEADGGGPSDVVTVGPSALTFTAADWDVAQTVTVSGVPDMATGTGRARVDHTVAGGGYDGVAVEWVPVLVDDDDGARTGVTLSETALVVPEDGEATYTVVLNAPGTRNVFTGMTVLDADGGSVIRGQLMNASPRALTFTPADWNVAQTVTVSGVPDGAVGDRAGSLLHITNGGGYSNLRTTLPVTVAGGEVAISPASLTVAEADDEATDRDERRATFTVTLNARPAGEVRLASAVRPPSGLGVSPGALTFTTADWSAPRTVTVTGAPDDAVGDRTATVAWTVRRGGPAGAPVGAVEVRVTADDTAGVTVSETALTVAEAGPPGVYTIVLDAKPTGAVTVGVSNDGPLLADVAPSSLTFTATDWFVPHPVTVSGRYDAAAGDPSMPATLSHTIAGGGYDGVTVPDVTVTVTDVDASSGVTISPRSLTVAEADDPATPNRREHEAVYTVVLDAAPAGPVTVGPASTNPAVARVAPSSLTFTPGSWSTAQTVTVTGVPDRALGPHGAIVTHAVTGAPGLRAGAVRVQVTNVEAPGLTLSASSVAVAEAGGEATWTVALAAAPTAAVTVAVASGDEAAAEVAPASLTFTPGRWSEAQTVTVTGVADAAVGERRVGVTHVAAGAGSGYAGVTAAPFTVRVTDDDAPGATVDTDPGAPGAQDGPLRVAESGGTEAVTAHYTIVLDAEPVGAVTVAVSSDDEDAARASPSSLTFTPGSWSEAQTVTVTGVDDAVVGDRAAEITHAFAGSGYGAVSVPAVAVTVADGDARVTLSASSVTVAEAGGEAAYTVALAAAPAGTVTVAVASGDEAAAEVAPASLTFTPGSWSAAQTVTVTGVADATAGERRVGVTHTAAGAGSGYDGVTAAPFTVTVTDDDVPGATVDTDPGTPGVQDGPLRVAESGAPAAVTATYTIVLDRAPAGMVTVAVSSDDEAAARVSPASLTFTPGSWSRARTVTVTGVDDAVVGARAAEITHAFAGSGYGAVSVPGVAVTVTDGDARVTLSASSVTVAEAGGEAAYTVVLAAAPAGTVTVAVASGDEAAAEVAPASLTFTPGSWSAARTVTVTGVADVAVGERRVGVTHVAAGAGSGYAGVTAAPFTVTVTDDDVPGATVDTDPATPGAQDDPLRVAESGAPAAVTAIYTIVLDRAPAGMVTVAASSDDEDAARVSPASLTFTPESWSTARTVTVTGVDDATLGERHVNITHAFAGSGYGAVSVPEILVVVASEDVARVQVSKSSVTVAEDAVATWTVVLAAAPGGTVTVAVASGDEAAVEVAPASLTFTAGSWNAARTVTATGVPDGVLGDRSTTVTYAAAGAGSGYEGVTAPPTAVTVANAEAFGVTLSTASVTVAETDDAATPAREHEATWTVTLDAALTGAVTVAVSSDDASVVAVRPASLTFAPGSWNAPRTVTATAVPDRAFGDRATAVVLAAASDGYGGVTRRLPVRVTDTSVPGVTVDTDPGAPGLQAGPVWVAESGSPAVTTATYTVRLDVAPAERVTMTVSSGDTGIAMVNPPALTFHPGTWDEMRTVVVTGVDDSVDNPGDHRETTITHTVAGGRYGDGDDVTVDAVAVRVVDDEGSGFNLAPFVVSVSPATIAENGGRSTVTVRQRRNETLDSDLVFLLGLTGTATKDADYVIESERLTLAVGQRSVTTTVTALDDFIDDDAETVVVEVVHEARASSATITIADDDDVYSPVPSFGAAVVSDRYWLRYEPIEAVTLPPAPGGDGRVTYTLRPALPAGLTFDAAARTIRGTPTATRAQAEYTYAATDSDADSDALTFDIEVAARPVSYVWSTTLTAGSLVDDEGAARPGNPVGYLAPDSGGLKTGSLGDDTITYRGSTAVLERVLLYTSAPFAGLLTLDASLAPGSTAIPGDFRMCIGGRGFAFNPWSGDLASIQGSGLTGLGNTLVLALPGQPCPAVGDSLPDFGTATVPDQSWSRHWRVAGVTLPAATGGNGTLTYALRPALPAGLTFDAATRTISGVPTATMSQAEYTYTATDADASNPDSDSLTFDIEVAHVLPAWRATLTVEGWTSGAISYRGFDAPRSAGSLSSRTITHQGATFRVDRLRHDATGQLEVGGTWVRGDTAPSGTFKVCIDGTGFAFNPWGGSRGTFHNQWHDSSGLSWSEGDTVHVSLVASARGCPAATGVPDTVPAFGDRTVPRQSWARGTPIAPLTLPEATGDGVLTYTLAGPGGAALPAGLTFDASSRTLTGTPASTQAAATYTYTATDGDIATEPDSASLTFVIEVLEPGTPIWSATMTVGEASAGTTNVGYGFHATESVGSLSEREITHQDATARVDVLLARGTGAGRGVSVLANWTEGTTAPSGSFKLCFDGVGLAFDPWGGTPGRDRAAFLSVPGDSGLSSWSKGDTVDVSLVTTAQACRRTASRNLVPSFGDETVRDQSWIVGRAFAGVTLPEATGGDGTLAYTLRPDLPAGVTFDAATRTLGGTPAAAMAQTGYTYTATEGGVSNPDAVSLQFDITVSGNPPIWTATVTVGESAHTPPARGYRANGGVGSITGGTITSGGATAELKQALVFGDGELVLGAVRAAATTVPGGPFTMCVDGAPFAFDPWGGSAGVDHFRRHAGSGLSWEVLQKVALALVPSSQTCPSATVDRVPGFGAATVSDQSWFVGESIAAVTLPEATGGDGALTYTLRPDLPDGLTFDAATRTISGTPTAEQARTAYAWTVTDGDTVDPNMVSLTFDVTVKAAGVSVSPGALTVTEAAGAERTATYAVVLETPPPGAVTVTPSSDAAGAATVSGALTFTTASWSAAQTVTVTGQDDDVDNGGDRTVTVTHAVSGYGAVVEGPPVEVTVTDDDVAGVSVSPGALTVTEAAGAERTATYAVVLDSRPPGEVTVTPASDAASAATVSPASLTFAAASWSAARTVTVTGQDDDVDNGGDRVATVTHAVSGYGDVAEGPPVEVTVADDDMVGVSVSPGALTVTEAAGAGRTATYAVVLDARPSAAVTVTLSNDAASAATVSPESLTFTAASWSAARTVTVTGLDDDADNTGGRREATIAHAVAGAGSGYESVTAPSVTVVVSDDDGPTFGAATVTGRTYARDTRIPALRLPAATGGNGALTYTLAGPDGAALPAGLTFDATSRTLRGTPAATQPATTYTYTAADADLTEADAARLEFTIEVVAHPVIWLARMTVGETNGTRGYDRAAGVGSLAPSATISHQGATAEVTRLLVVTADGELRLGTTRGGGSGPAPSGSFKMCFGDTAFAFDPWGGRAVTVGGSGLSWTDGATVGVALVISSQPCPAGGAFAAPGKPAAPAVTAVQTGSKTRLDVSWTAPSNPGSRILSYDLRYRADTSEVWTDGPRDRTGRSASITGLAPGMYHVQVRATNAYDDGPWSDSGTGKTTDVIWTATLTVGESTDSDPAQRLKGYSASAGYGSLTSTSITYGSSTATPRNIEVTGNGALYLDGYRSGTNLGDDFNLCLDGTAFGWAPFKGGGVTRIHRNSGLSWSAGDTVHVSLVPSTAACPTVGVVDRAPAFAPGATIADRSYKRDVEIAPLSLPGATGGDGTLTYTLEGPDGGALPAGLTFDALTRTLTGTPSAAQAAATYTYRATDGDALNPDSVRLRFAIEVVVNLAPAFAPDASIADRSYKQHVAIPALVLPEATGGDGTLTYTLEGPDGAALPAGLTFDAGARTLGGTPSAVQAATTYTYTATDADAENPDTVSLAFTIAVTANAVPAFGEESVGARTYKQGTPVDETLPEATGGDGALTYTLEGPDGGALPAGLTFDAGARTLGGTPSAVQAAATYTYTATDADAEEPDSASLAFTIEVVPDRVPTFGGSVVSGQSYTQGVAVDETLPAASGGDGTLAYTLEGPDGGALPAGLTFDAAARTLSGTPTATQAAATYTYTATDADDVNPDSARLTFTITVAGPPAWSATLTVGETGGTRGYRRSGSIGSLSPSNAISHQGATANVNQILVDTASGRLQLAAVWPASSGPAPSGSFRMCLDGTGFAFNPWGGTRSLVHRVNHDDSGLSWSVGDMVKVSLVPSSQACPAVGVGSVPSFGEATIGSKSYTQGVAVAETLPEATGGDGTLRYTLSPAPPAGLTFDATARTLSGTPSAARAAAAYTYTATDAGPGTPDAVSLVFTIEVAADLAPSFAPGATIANRKYTQGTAVETLSLPAATGGNGALAYTLEGPGGAALPAGLTFDATARTLAGTPSAVQSATTYTYTATDSDATDPDSVSLAFTIEVTALVGTTMTTTVSGVEVRNALGAGGLRVSVDGSKFRVTVEGGANDGAWVVLPAGARVVVDEVASNSPSRTTTPPGYEARGPDDALLDVAVTGLEAGEAAELCVPFGGTGKAALFRWDGSAWERVGDATTSRPVCGTKGGSFSPFAAFAAVDLAPSFAPGASIENRKYTRGTAIGTLSLPAATGGDAPLVYTLEGPDGAALPAGLTFDATARTLTGTPSAVQAATTYTYTVTDSDESAPDVATLTFTIEVIAGPIWTATLTVGEASAGSSNVNKGYDSGENVGSLTDTSITYQGATTDISSIRLYDSDKRLRLRDTWTSGTRPTGSFKICFDGTGFAYDPWSGTRGGPRLITISSSSGLSWSVGDEVEVSLVTSTQACPGGTVADLEPSFAPGATIADQAYTRGTAIGTLSLPAATGGNTPLTYTLEGAGGAALPAGLTFDATARTLSGTPSAVQAATTYTYTVTDSDATAPDTDTLTFTIEVAGTDLEPSFGDATIADRTYEQGTAIGTLSLPEATGGNTPLAYTLEGAGGAALPAGLTFDATARTLAGTPSAVQAATTYTYTVTDSDLSSPDSDTLTFAIEVVAAGTDLVPTFGDASIEDKAWKPSLKILTVTLPEATGGNGTLAYTLSPALPAGLTFDAQARTIAGTPSVEQPQAAYTYRATDADVSDPDTAELVFHIIVARIGLVFSRTSLEVAEAGGVGTFTVKLTSPPDDDFRGLRVTTEAIRLEGAPEADAFSGRGSVELSPSGLRFTGANWNVAHTVTVTGVDDALGGDRVVTLHYRGRPERSARGTVRVRLRDDDAQGVTVAPSRLRLEETGAGSEGTYTVVLDAAPAGAVVVAAESADEAVAVVAGPAALTFTAADWDEVRTVTVRAVDDARLDAVRSATIRHALSGAGSAGLGAGAVSVAVANDDVATVTVAPRALTVPEHCFAH